MFGNNDGWKSSSRNRLAALRARMDESKSPPPQPANYPNESSESDEVEKDSNLADKQSDEETKLDWTSEETDYDNCDMSDEEFDLHKPLSEKNLTDFEGEAKTHKAALLRQHNALPPTAASLLEPSDPPVSAVPHKKTDPYGGTENLTLATSGGAESKQKLSKEELKAQLMSAVHKRVGVREDEGDSEGDDDLDVTPRGRFNDSEDDSDSETAAGMASTRPADASDTR